MKGRVLGKSANKYETWVADSGTSVSIIIARRNRIKWRLFDPDETNYSGVTGTELNHYMDQVQHLKESPRDPSSSVQGGEQRKSG